MHLSKSFLVICFILVLGVLSRFLYVWTGDDTLANFSGIGALALFSGTYIKGRLRWILPLSMLWISDLILNNVYYAEYYDSFRWFGMGTVYLCFALIITFAYVYLRQPTWMKVLGAGVISAIGFFIITNLDVWISPGSPYSKDLAGILLCFEMALPFFRNALLGNLIYGALFFGLYEWVASRDVNVPSVVTRLI